jgi:hypothetical protein
MMMKSALIAAMVFLAAGAAENSRVQIPPLGFYTLDLTKEFWASIDDAHRLKGGMADVLPYEGIKRIIVLRCNMHVPGGGWLDKFIRGRLAEGARFETGPLPESNTRDLRSPLLTVLVETQKGDLGLLTIHSDAAFLELNGRFGLVLVK